MVPEAWWEQSGTCEVLWRSNIGLQRGRLLRSHHPMVAYGDKRESGGQGHWLWGRAEDLHEVVVAGALQVAGAMHAGWQVPYNTVCRHVGLQDWQWHPGYTGRAGSYGCGLSMDLQPFARSST